jgi:hypothetical protein
LSPSFDVHNHIISSGIDWVTATVAPGRRQDLLTGFASGLIHSRAKEGYQSRSWTGLGYQGETIDGCTIASRPDGALIRLSGEVARKHAPYVLQWAQNITRLDVQVTLCDPDPGFDWSAYVLKTASMDARVRAGMTKTTRIVSTPEGKTTYIGSRKSSRFYRVYDKHAESKGVYPRGTWRWEVEYKAARSQSLGASLAGDAHQAERCRGIVRQAFADYGVIVPCDPITAAWRDQSPREETTDERRLAWLRTTIAPCVERMLESNDPATLLEALGLGAYVPEDRRL